MNWWYLAGSVYPMEPYPEQPAAMMANSPWSGHYSTRLALWGYAHYGQFSKVGWQYLNGACGKLSGGGTFVTLKSPGQDYSVIIETKNAQTSQNVTFNLSGGLSTGKLCVWRSSAAAQFVQQAKITPRNGSFTIALEPKSIYSISTTTGQKKGSFDRIPAEKSFPFPYFETFDEYAPPNNSPAPPSPVSWTAFRPCPPPTPFLLKAWRVSSPAATPTPETPRSLTTF